MPDAPEHALFPTVLAAIAVGSNLGDRSAHVAGALRGLRALPRSRLVAASEPIETDPVGPPGQGPYLNAAALVETQLAPEDLLASLLAIERARGRRRTPGERWGPRTLDLDLLLYGDRVIEAPGLSVPHPRLRERLFVLRPLAAVAPDLPVPPDGRPVRELLDALLPAPETADALG